MFLLLVSGVCVCIFRLMTSVVCYMMWLNYCTANKYSPLASWFTCGSHFFPSRGLTMIQYLSRNTDDRHLQRCNSTTFTCTANINGLNLFPTRKTAHWRVDSVYAVGQENKSNQQMQEKGWWTQFLLNSMHSVQQWCHQVHAAARSVWIRSMSLIFNIDLMVRKRSMPGIYLQFVHVRRLHRLQELL